jgi:proteasome assembly chaperone 4
MFLFNHQNVQFFIIRVLNDFFPWFVLEMSSQVECSLSASSFSDSLCSSDIVFQVLKMKNSVFVWIGSAEEKRLDDLSLAMLMADSEIVSSRLMGNILTPTTLITKRLCKKLGKPVYLSYNLPQSDNMLLEVVNKRLIKEIDQFPDRF